MAAIDDVADRPHAAPHMIFKLDLPHGFQINRCDLLAPTQIAQRFGARRGSDAIGNAAAHAAAIESKNKAGPLRGAAMEERKYAKRPMQADEPGGNALKIGKARTPHQ